VLAIGRQLPGIGLTDTLAGFSIPLIFADAVELGELNRLTTRELEVLALIGAGKTIKEAGAELHRSPKTVERVKPGLPRAWRGGAALCQAPSFSLR